MVNELNETYRSADPVSRRTENSWSPRRIGTVQNAPALLAVAVPVSLRWIGSLKEPVSRLWVSFVVGNSDVAATRRARNG